MARKDFMLGECLPFRPPEEYQQNFDDVPRYLFRVFTPNITGAINTSWVRSTAAIYARSESRVDIFDRNDDSRVASMINGHLRWRRDWDDNLVTWTSSLLYALVYIFYRHATDGFNFDNICLGILDTTGFPKGTFIRDMDLIRTYSPLNERLANLENLRAKQHREFKGTFYFGEYLSQGALKIEDKCAVVSAQSLIASGLYDILPEFELLAQRPLSPNPEWANQVIRLREVFYSDEPRCQEVSSEEIQAAMQIGELFGPPWRLPLAINLLALVPRQPDDRKILQAFQAFDFTDEEKLACSPSNTKVMAYDSLPEVKQFDVIRRSIFKDFFFSKTNDRLQEMEVWLHVPAYDLPIADRDSIMDDTRFADVWRRLELLNSLSQKLRWSTVRANGVSR